MSCEHRDALMFLHHHDSGAMTDILQLKGAVSLNSERTAGRRHTPSTRLCLTGRDVEEYNSLEANTLLP